MVRRTVNDGQNLTFMHLIDTDGDGYANKVLWVDYRPLMNNSRVDVWLYDYDNGTVKLLNNNDNLGESIREGGLRVEYGVSFADLGIYPGQTIDMQIWTLSPGGYISDYSQIVTWSPANALGWVWQPGEPDYGWRFVFFQMRFGAQDVKGQVGCVFVT